MGDKGRERKCQTLSFPPEASALSLMGSGCRGMREPRGPRDQKTKALEEVQGGGGEKWGPGHCVGEPPLYLFQSLLGLGLPCTWGPSCFVGSVTSALVMVMEGPLSQGGRGVLAPLCQPAQINSQRGLKLLFPPGGGRMWAQDRPKTTGPSHDLPLSKAPEKEWNLNIETLFWP